MRDLTAQQVHLDRITWGGWYWPLALLIVGGVAGVLFFPAEIYAAFTNMQNTLSDYSRYELNLETATGGVTHVRTWAWWTTLVVWLGFVGWITPHIWFLGP